MGRINIMKPILALTLMALLAGTARAEHVRAKLISLVGLPGSTDLSIVYRMSEDGHFIVGEAPLTDGPHGEGAVALRHEDGSWSVQKLGFFPANDSHYSPAFGVSRHGRVIVGVGSFGDLGQRFRKARGRRRHDHRQFRTQRDLRAKLRKRA